MGTSCCHNFSPAIANTPLYHLQALCATSISHIRTQVEAEVYAQRIDWLVSGDDGEDSFHRRLQHELQKLDVVDTVGFTGIARIFDRDVQAIQNTSKELAQ